MAPGRNPTHPSSGSGSGSGSGPRPQGTATGGGTPSTTTGGAAPSRTVRPHSGVPATTIGAAAGGGLVGLALLMLLCMRGVERWKRRRGKVARAAPKNASELQPADVQPPAQPAVWKDGDARGEYSALEQSGLRP